MTAGILVWDFIFIFWPLTANCYYQAEMRRELTSCNTFRFLFFFIPLFETCSLENKLMLALRKSWGKLHTVPPGESSALCFHIHRLMRKISRAQIILHNLRDVAPFNGSTWIIIRFSLLYWFVLLHRPYLYHLQLQQAKQAQKNVMNSIYTSLHSR